MDLNKAQEFSLLPFRSEIDMPLLKEWAELRQVNFPFGLLPPTGLVVYHGYIPVCVGFLTKTDSNIAVIGNLLGDPRATSMVRNHALDLLIEELFMRAQGSGFPYVCLSTNLPKLQERYKRLGFTLQDEDIKIFGRKSCH